MIKQPLPVLTILLLLIIAGFGCKDSATDADSGPAVVDGRVESVSSFESEQAQIQDVEGATVAVAEVTSDGSLEIVGGAEAETGQQGAYMLEIPGDALTNVPAASRMVVQAESSDGTGKTFVTSEINSGTTVFAKPVTVESTMEAEILEQVVSNGDEGMVENAEIEAAVGTQAAAALENDAAAVEQVAILLANQADIRTELYNNEDFEFSNGLREDIEEIERDAQIELENRLHDLEDAPEEQQQAFNTFLETLASAELQAGVEANAEVKASDMAAYLVVNGDAELPGEAEAEIYRINSYQKAVALDEAVRNQLQAIGAEEGTISIAEDAGSTLESEILSNTDATVEEINTLFANYNNEIVTAIENDGSLDGETFSTVNDIISGEGGVIEVFESAIEGISDAGIIVNAYNNFYGNVRSTVDASFGEAEADVVDAYTELLILLNI